MERASIVIVNWNAGAVLHDCLAAVFASDCVGRDQVIVVDNASTDGSQCQLTATYPTLEVIQNSRNVGFAPAVNQGLRAARGEFAVLLNPDVVLGPYALFRLIEFMTEHPEAGVAGPRLLDCNGALQGSARRDPSAWTALFGRSAPLTRLFPSNPVSQREIPALAVEAARRSRSTGSPAPASSRAGPRGKASGSSTNASSCSGRTRTGVAASGRQAGGSTTCRAPAGPTSSE